MIVVRYHDGSTETFGEAGSYGWSVRGDTLEISDRPVHEERDGATHVRYTRTTYIPLANIRSYEA